MLVLLRACDSGMAVRAFGLLSASHLIALRISSYGAGHPSRHYHYQYFQNKITPFNKIEERIFPFTCIVMRFDLGSALFRS